MLSVGPANVEVPLGFPSRRSRLCGSGPQKRGACWKWECTVSLPALHPNAGPGQVPGVSSSCSK